MPHSYKDIRTLIENHQSFLLTTHVNPDGDGIGSEVALALYLKSKGKKVRIRNADAVPENYLFLKHLHPIEQFNASVHADQGEAYDVIILLDGNHPSRLAGMKTSIEQSDAVKVCIDHHLEPEAFADLYILDESATSTGEIIYRILMDCGNENISSDIATALYTAIMTDTGSFRYPKTDSEVHTIVAHLIEAGADPAGIYEKVYENNSAGRMQLLGLALANLKTLQDGKIAYMTLTQEMFQRTGTSEADTDAFVPYTLAVRGVHVGLMFSELEGMIKVNFRSKGDIRINELAKEFHGNGHKNAAGARIPGGRLIEIIPQVLDRTKIFLLDYTLKSGRTKEERL